MGSIRGESGLYESAAYSYVGASFSYGRSNPYCTVSRENGCTTAICTGDNGGEAGGGGMPQSFPHAGEIVLSGGIRNATLTPDSDGLYYPDSDSTYPLFAGDDLITVTATGGGVDGFSEQLRAPSLITLTAPELSFDNLVIDTTRDLDVSWTGGPLGDVEVFVFAQAENGSQFTNRAVSCVQSVNSGTQVVPSAVLGDFLTYGTGTLKIRNEHRTAFDSGEFEITFVLLAAANAPDALGERASVPVVFE